MKKLGFIPPANYKKVLNKYQLEEDKLNNLKKYNPELKLVLDKKASEEEGGSDLVYEKKVLKEI